MKAILMKILCIMRRLSYQLLLLFSTGVNPISFAFS